MSSPCCDHLPELHTHLGMKTTSNSDLLPSCEASWHPTAETYLVGYRGENVLQERLLRRIIECQREPNMIGLQDYTARECVIPNPTPSAITSVITSVYHHLSQPRCSGLSHCATSLEHTFHTQHDDSGAIQSHDTANKHYYNHSHSIPQPEPF